jgi:hypothetical protein
MFCQTLHGMEFLKQNLCNEKKEKLPPLGVVCPDNCRGLHLSFYIGKLIYHQ